jgi:hypothetical protein
MNPYAKSNPLRVEDSSVEPRRAWFVVKKSSSYVERRRN